MLVYSLAGMSETFEQRVAVFAALGIRLGWRWWMT
jgi:hypothetical protein